MTTNDRMGTRILYRWHFSRGDDRRAVHGDAGGRRSDLPVDLHDGHADLTASRTNVSATRSPWGTDKPK